MHRLKVQCVRHEKITHFDGVELDPSTIWSPPANGRADALAELVKLLARQSVLEDSRRLAQLTASTGFSGDS